MPLLAGAVGPPGTWLFTGGLSAAIKSSPDLPSGELHVSLLGALTASTSQDMERPGLPQACDEHLQAPQGSPQTHS